ncbi:Zn(II)2Cys6 transcription factor domain-containing protein [Aspergillus undulatus]|uniref:Zn(II)2Cys6 transcription factor domain-containing protein n=1 Tax=Aspergillus undulatus TaxID=1810928 RepID=UPI003CCD0BAD
MSEPQAPKKRAACDRCRTQKLRCLRVSGHPNDFCIRCVRSQMECITSSSKRPGRPRNSTNTPRQQPDPTPPTTCIDANPPLPAVDIPPQSLENVDDWFNFGSIETDYELCSAPWNSVDSGFESGFAMDGVATTHSMSSVSTHPLQTASPAFFNTIPALQDDPYDQLQLLAPQPLAVNFDHGLHLSQLQRELSKQLYTLTSMPWDMTKVMQLSCQGDTASSPEGDLKSNPLAKIAKTSAEFAQLLCSVQTPIAGDGGSSTSKTSSPSSSIHPRLSMADLLTILSCHMLTISIYDSIFSHFTEQASHNPGAVNIVLQSAPKLFLGGIAVPPRLELLGHLLYCVTASQLRPVEMLLGLPDECCVSLRRNSTNKEKQTGLFSGQSGQLLFSTLMQVETERASEGQGGLGVIESLKEKIRRIQGF